MAIFGFIYSLLQAIPVLDKAMRDFLVFYAIKQKEWFDAEVTKAVDEAISTGKTGSLENAIGSPRANKPSGNAGSEYDDPNVP